MSKVPPITLNNGVEMPQLGFGVWQVPDAGAETAGAVAAAAALMRPPARRRGAPRPSTPRL